MALKDIKAKIAATKRMNTVTRAMEAVSAVKMRKTQASAFAGRPYARAALSILARLSGTGHFSSHPLLKAREVKKIALVVITADKGLAGSVNSAVLKRAAAIAADYPKESVLVYPYGKKGFEFFSNRGFQMTTEGYLSNNSDVVSLTEMRTLADELSDRFMRADFDKVVVVYQNFKSTFEQIPTARTLLPLSLEELTNVVADIRPAKGKWADQAPLAAPAAYGVEPEGQEVLSALVPRLTAVSLYHMLLEAKASEHSARMVAMKNASDKSKEVVRDLTRKFNKVRQAAITREVSEIVGGREALAT